MGNTAPLAVELLRFKTGRTEACRQREEQREMDTNNTLVAIALAGMLVSSAALAGGDVVPNGGTPFCVDKDHLQEYVLAALHQDNAWVKQLNDCGLLQGGTRIGIIEELPSGSTLGHVSKVRVISRTGVSVVGYILVIEGQ